VALASFAVAAISLSACAGSAVSQAAGNRSGGTVSKIVIGALHPTTGANAADGQQMDNGAQLAVDAINAAGGIKSLGGAKLELAKGDTQGKADVGQSEATRLIQGGAVALIGTFQSATSANVAAVAERNKVPFVMSVSALDDILQKGYHYSFRLQPNASAMGKQGASALIDMSKQAGHPVKKVAFLYENGNFGQAALKAFRAEAQAAGVTVGPAISYDAFSVSDMTTQITQVASSGADTLAVAGYYRDSLLISQAIAAVKPKLNAVFGVADGGYDQPQFVTDAPGGGANYFNANFHWDVTNPDAVALAKTYQAKFGQTVRTSAVFSYDAVMVIAQALEKSGSVDKSKLRDAIAATSYKPLVVSNGPITFDGKGENTNAAIVVMQVQSGAVKQVYPSKLAESPFVYPAPVVR
jgi:branched-chain amino acid transport system substrate-binding protein